MSLERDTLGPGRSEPLTSLTQRLATPSRWPRGSGICTGSPRHTGGQGGQTTPPRNPALPRSWGGREQPGVQTLKPGSLCPGPPTGPVRGPPRPPPRRQRSILPWHLLARREASPADVSGAPGTSITGAGSPTPTSQGAGPGHRSLSPQAPCPAASPRAVLFRDPTGREPHRNKTQAGACAMNGSGAICPVNRGNCTKATRALLPPGKSLSSLILSLRSPRPQQPLLELDHSCSPNPE